ncbi:MAG: mRNA surveillance protein pelota [Nanoarchaeota archaeon]|nr:mRNA surveillance protein pelota [Nanoarchaeota archaeon]
MKLLKTDKTRAKVLVENLDDLWYLNSIIDSGDVVEGMTLRKIKIGDSGERNQKIIKKPVYLKLNVEKIEFHPYSNILRVSGKVVEGTDDVPAGSYHTFSVEEQSTITIEKNEWLRFQKTKLDEATKEKKPDILVVVLDRDEAHFALLKKYGYEFLTSLQGNVQKKVETTQQTTNFYEECITVLKEYIERYGINRVIVASPAFWKEDFLKNVKDNELREKIVLATSSSADRSAINEVLKRDEVKSVLAEARISEEMKLVETLMSEISKNNLAAYGMDEVETAVNSGAVNTLLVTDSLIRRLREEENFKRLDSIMRTADKVKVDVHIISSEHEGGKRLDGLGGIGAILRYKMNY